MLSFELYEERKLESIMFLLLLCMFDKILMEFLQPICKISELHNVYITQCQVFNFLSSFFCFLNNKPEC